MGSRLRITRLLLVSIVAFMTCAPASIASARANTPATNCALGNSQKVGITITSCQYNLVDSPAGNANYYLVVAIKYVTSSPLTAVRFAFNIDGAMRYMVARGSLVKGANSVQFQLVSPKPTVQKLTCWADQAAT
jgi:hypothetical protein